MDCHFQPASDLVSTELKFMRLQDAKARKLIRRLLLLREHQMESLKVTSSIPKATKELRSFLPAKF